jgi:regulatory protein
MTTPENHHDLALDQALRFLGYRARSAQEVRTRLQRYGHDPEVIESVIARLLELSYLDDETFALVLARDYLGAPKPRGERAILAKLREKGVAEEVARAALDQALEEAEEDPRERVIRAAERWCRRLRPGEDQDRARRRLWGYLSRAGFDQELIRSAIEQVLPR